MHHRNTRIYRRALQLTALAAQTIPSLPQGYAFLADQLRRSTSSVALNFAEAHGKESPRERRRFFRIAKGSALESAAAFEVAAHLGALPTAVSGEAQDLCDHIAAMLHRYL